MSGWVSIEMGNYLWTGKLCLYVSNRLGHFSLVVWCVGVFCWDRLVKGSRLCQIWPSDWSRESNQSAQWDHSSREHHRRSHNCQVCKSPKFCRLRRCATTWPTGSISSSSCILSVIIVSTDATSCTNCHRQNEVRTSCMASSIVTKSVSVSHKIIHGVLKAVTKWIELGKLNEVGIFELRF